MKKEFIPYELAVKLKELGFDEPCFGYYIELRNPKEGILTTDKVLKCFDGVSAPTFSQALRWFREKYNVWCWIEKYSDKETYIYQIPKANFTKIQGYHNTYEEAELACITKLIEIVEQQNQK